MGTLSEPFTTSSAWSTYLGSIHTLCPKTFFRHTHTHKVLKDYPPRVFHIQVFCSRICVKESTCQKPRVSTHTRLKENLNILLGLCLHNKAEMRSNPLWKRGKFKKFLRKDSLANQSKLLISLHIISILILNKGGKFKCFQTIEIGKLLRFLGHDVCKVAAAVFVRMWKRSVQDSCLWEAEQVTQSTLLLEPQQWKACVIG